ncbi:MAG TPA: methyltransferase domain-containing protein [Ktedonobacteraceae bacterium]|nr:methyltransferase domain-containing protein [Ktedonobacteraceae bacterium]
MFTHQLNIRRTVPTWHAEDSPWKATQILHMLERHTLPLHSICDVGCGVGGVLAQLQKSLDQTCTFQGYDVSAHAIEVSKHQENEQLHYEQRDFSREGKEHFDLMLLFDVMEHVEDYYSFLRNLQPKATYKMIHVSLELSVLSVFRRNALLDVRKTFDLHYFTKDLLLAVVSDVGYEVVDYIYTPRAIGVANNLKKKAMILSRRLLFSLNNDVCWADLVC